MRLTLAAMITLAAVMLSVVGCTQEPWAAADGSIAELTLQMAEHARSGDAHYFEGLVAAREKVPDVITQVARSNIATNYPDHLIVESDSDASLVYYMPSDVPPGTSFTVSLSLVQGKARIDQIVAYDTGEVIVDDDALARPRATSSVSGSEARPTNLSLLLPSDRVVAGTEQTALLSYVNATEEIVAVPSVPAGEVRITDTMGGLISSWESSGKSETAQTVQLAPLQRTYVAVRFDAPKSGFYLVHGRAFGEESLAVSLQTVDERRSGGVIRAVRELLGLSSD